MAYLFKMQATTRSGSATGAVKSLETDFSGLHYVSMTGLLAKGEPKNIYTEDYAEGDGLRVYHPKDVTGGVVHRKETEVELTLVFTGDSRRDVYDSFCAFVRDSRVFYWDTARYRKVWLVLTSATEPTDDTIKGMLYLKASFKFKNLWGEGKKCNANGVLV